MSRRPGGDFSRPIAYLEAHCFQAAPVWNNRMDDPQAALPLLCPKM